MVIKYQIFILLLAVQVNSSDFHLFFPQVDAKHGKMITNEENSTLTSPVALFRQNLYSKHYSAKHKVKLERNNTARKEKDEDKIKETSIKFQSKFSALQDHVFGIMLILIGTLSLMGNTCTFILFYFHQKKVSPVEVLIVHLAIVDVLTTLVSYPLPIIAVFKHGWPFGDLVCIVYALLSEFLQISGVYSITLIAIIRYLKICKPNVGVQITFWTCCKLVAFGNLLAFLWALTPLVIIGKYDAEPFGVECAVSWIANDIASRLRSALKAIFLVVLPLALIGICYLCIAKRVNKSTTQLRSNHLCRRNSKINIEHLTCIGTLAALNFAITWIPLTMVLLMFSFRGAPTIPIWVTLIPVVLAKLFVALNPFVYVFYTRRYRKRFFGLISKWMCNRTEDEKPRRLNLDRKNTTLFLKFKVEGNQRIEVFTNSAGGHVQV